MIKNERYIKYKAIFKMVATILSWVAFLLLVIIGAFLLYYVVSAQIYARKGEEYKPPFSLYTIVSPSMEPKVKVYDVILNISVKDKSTIQKGDIITFVSSSALTNGMTITHRVIDIITKDNKLFFRTKGDNNKTPDVGMQSEENILGKTVLKIPQLGHIQFFLASRSGWIFAILIPAAGIIIYDIMKIFKLVGVKNKIDNVTKDSSTPINKNKSENEQKRKEHLKKKIKKPKKISIIEEDLLDLTIENVQLPKEIAKKIKEEEIEIDREEDITQNIDSVLEDLDKIDEKMNDFNELNNKDQP